MERLQMILESLLRLPKDKNAWLFVFYTKKVEKLRTWPKITELNKDYS
jgi:hypothetical protein